MLLPYRANPSYREDTIASLLLQDHSSPTTPQSLHHPILCHTPKTSTARPNQCTNGTRLCTGIPIAHNQASSTSSPWLVANNIIKPVILICRRIQVALTHWRQQRLYLANHIQLDNGYSSTLSKSLNRVIYESDGRKYTPASVFDRYWKERLLLA